MKPTKNYQRIDIRTVAFHLCAFFLWQVRNEVKFPSAIYCIRCVCVKKVVRQVSEEAVEGEEGC